MTTAYRPLQLNASHFLFEPVNGERARCVGQTMGFKRFIPPKLPRPTHSRQRDPLNLRRDLEGLDVEIGRNIGVAKLPFFLFLSTKVPPRACTSPWKWDAHLNLRAGPPPVAIAGEPARPAQRLINWTSMLREEERAGLIRLHLWFLAESFSPPASKGGF